MDSKIKNLKAREILNSRGNPTVEVELETNDGVFRASVPSGTSTGRYEAMELRDGGKRYQGRGVLKAIVNVNEIILPKLKGKDPIKQKEIDELMIELDGTRNKAKLGANAILPVSIAVCRAGAKAKKIPLWKYISKLTENSSLSIKIPVPCFNIVEGGAHAGNNLDIQEFMIIPQKKSFLENLQAGSEIYHILKEILKKIFGKQAINIGDEGGFAPPISNTKGTLDLISKAINLQTKRAPTSKFGGEGRGQSAKIGLPSTTSGKVVLGLDCAASQFYKDNKYHLEGTVFTKEGLLLFYQDLMKNYPMIFLEDPFAEEDWQSFQKFTKKFAKRINIIGDDLLATNIERIKEARQKKACNGIIIKPNQIGTISETLEAVKLAKSFGWQIIVSHRSGDTCDDFISDLAVGIGADLIKAGAPARGERVAKYNRLLRIEEEMQ